MYDYTYYGYDYGYGAAETATGLAAFGIVLLIFWLIIMGVSVFTLICMWKVFKKAGKPGWAAIIPIYNIIVMLEIAELPMWYIALYFVPGANIYAMIKINIEIAHKFGKSTGFGVGMALLSPVFLAMLAFGKNVNFMGTQNNVQQMQPTYQQPVQPPVQPQVQPSVQPIQSVEPVMPVDTLVTPVAPVVTPVTPVQPEVVPVQETVVPPVVEPIVQQPTPEIVQPQINQTAAPAFCTNCGNALVPNAKFCTKCGKQI